MVIKFKENMIYRSIKNNLIKYFSILLFIIYIPFSSKVLLGSILIESELFFQDNLNIGERSTGVIRIRNTGEKPAKVNLYKKDYSFNSNGTNSYLEPGTLERSNADWITIVPEKVTIPGNGRVEINYTVKVPFDKALIGSYWSLIMAEQVTNPKLNNKKNNDNVRVGVFVSTRYGIQILTNIGLTGQKKLKFTKTKIKKNVDKEYLFVDVKNVGDQFLRTKIYAEFYDQSGNYIGKFLGEEKKRIYPDTSVRFKIDISKIKNGKYSVLIVADGEEEALFGIKYTLTIE
ncbi:MAG: hypothetical protein U9R41_07030 [Candidatus Marinimicrobia bacterium]|nr:hypothetical protein [Candidatus Neomarinimicrobiota bacterium]